MDTTDNLSRANKAIRIWIRADQGETCARLSVKVAWHMESSGMALPWSGSIFLVV
jgi:hypothetical protein